MSSEKPERRIQDIVENARSIFEYTAGMNLDGYLEDRRTRDAVERCLQRISEAASKLGGQGPTLVPTQEWHKLRALGNVLRHEYDRISPEIVWDIVQRRVPSLCADCEAALARLRSDQPL